MRYFLFFCCLSLLSFVGNAQDPNMTYYNQHCELIGKAFNDPKVKTFFPMAELKQQPGNPGTYSKGVYLSVSSERVTLDTVRCITRNAANHQEGNFPGGVPPYSKRYEIKKVLGEAFYELNDTIVYFYDKNIAVEFILKKGYAATVRVRQVNLWNLYYTAPTVVLMDHPSEARFIKYNNKPHPNPYPAGPIVRKAVADPIVPVVLKPVVYTIVSPVSVSFLYNAYQTDHLYFNKNFQFTGNNMNNGKMQGMLRLNNNIHMRGWFKQHSYYRYSPDADFLTTLYDTKDTTVSLQVHFNGYHALAPGSGFFFYNKKRYTVKVLNEVGLFGRAGVDFFSNQYFIDCFKYLSKNGTADTTAELNIEKFTYDVWYLTEVRKEDIKPNPTVVKKSKEQEQLNQLLDFTVKEIEKNEDNNFYIIERISNGIEGSAPFSKTIYPGTDKWEKYQVIFFVPSNFTLNMQYKAERTYYINGQRITEKINTAFEKFDLKNGVTGYRQLVGLPEKLDKTCCPSITVTLWRTANSASIPIRLLIKKNRF